MISRRNSIGERYIFAADGETLIAVHGKFCSGCMAVRGICGKLTNAAVQQGRITGRALEDLEAAQQHILNRLIERPEYVLCDFCALAEVPVGAVTYDGEHACVPCKPYAWASVVHPDTREANRLIAATRAARRVTA